MTTDDQVLIPEDQLWSTVGDSLGNGTCPAKDHKRSGSPNLEYIRPQYKRRPYIRQTNIVPATILSSEPRSVAGHVKKREGPKFAALPPPVSKSSVPSGVSQSGGDGTEEGEGGDTGGGNEEDEGDEGSEDDENGTNDEGVARAEIEEGSSDDEFESATSSLWSEGVGVSDPPDNRQLRPTPDSVIDATIAELTALGDRKRALEYRKRALEYRRRTVEAELHRARRKERDLDGPGWKLFARDTRSLGIEVYQLYSDGGRVWRYKAYDTGRGEIVSPPQDPEHCVEINVEKLKDAGWYREPESGAWKRYSTTEERRDSPFAVDPTIPRLPSSLQRTSDESQKGQDSDTLFLDPRGLGGSSTQGNTS
jgi:hypothetical protein